MISKISELFLNTNILVLLFVIMALGVTVGGWIVDSLSQFVSVPTSFSELYKYGKLRQERKLKSWTTKLEVPKKWFQHFYIIAVIYAAYSLYLSWIVCFQQRSKPQWFGFILDFLTVPNRVTVVDCKTAGTVLTLYSLQIVKRLYENLFLSVFSTSRMNVIHYLVGHVHYAGAFLLLLALFPGFSHYDDSSHSSDIPYFHTFCQGVGATLVAAAMYGQYDSLRRLAFLRISRKGTVLIEKYLMPSGGMFEFVSCPHMLCETVIYLSLASIMGFRHTWWNIVCLWVMCNQLQVAIMNHNWYKLKFEDYPTRRKAIVPFIL